MFAFLDVWDLGVLGMVSTHMSRAVAPFVSQNFDRLFRIHYNDVRMDVSAYHHLENTMAFLVQTMSGASLPECAAFLATQQIYSVRRSWAFLAHEDCKAVYDPYFYPEEESEEEWDDDC